MVMLGDKRKDAKDDLEEAPPDEPDIDNEFPF
jgi:hypothetical protein